jgi:RND family efflux transporter MFP subunit
MDFVSNQIDRASATVRARAIVDNKELQFTPGLFARVQLIGSGAYDAVMVPDEAIATDQASRVVFVVKDGKAELRTVTLGPLVDGLRVVRGGLSADDLVVVSGLQRIRAGQQVAVETAVAAKTANAASQELPQ